MAEVAGIWKNLGKEGSREMEKRQELEKPQQGPTALQ
jgi:hypothetical protein